MEDRSLSKIPAKAVWVWVHMEISAQMELNLEADSRDVKMGYQKGQLHSSMYHIIYFLSAIRKTT